MIEEWKDIPRFDGCYQVSNFGNVRSFSVSHKGFRRKEPKARALSLTHDGYQKVRLVANGKDITVRIHRLVAEMFVPNPDGKETVNHIDGNKQNNRADNLEWADRTEQLDHAYRMGLKVAKKGCDNSQSKLTPEQVNAIRAEYKKGSREFSSVKLGRKYGVSHRVILLIVKGKSYRNIK